MERSGQIALSDEPADDAGARKSVAPASDLPLTALAGWGNYPVVQGCERRSEDLERVTRDAVLTRGLGRSYGDSSLPPSGRCLVAGSPLADRLLAFDATTGVARVEAGFALATRAGNTAQENP